MKTSNSTQDLKVHPSMILASGSKTIKSKGLKSGQSNMLPTQTLRKIGSEIAILHHTGEKLQQKYKKKVNKIGKLKEKII